MDGAVQEDRAVAPTHTPSPDSSVVPSLERRLGRRRGIVRPEHIVIAASSIPAHTDLFRGRDLPTLILGTERFADAVRELQLTDVALQEVAVDAAS